MKSYYLSLALATVSIMVSGQKNLEPGFVITNQNDTLHGLINIKSNTQNSKSCIFQNKDEQTLQNFNPTEIIAFRTANKYYVTKEIEIDNIKQRVFLEFLVDGIIDLFYLKDKINEFYFIEKDTSMILLSNEQIEIATQGNGLSTNDKKYATNSNQYKRILRYLFQDSPGTLNKVSATSFDYKSLINITKEYHNSVCTDYECIEYSRASRQQIYLEPGIGLIHTKMGLKTSDDYATDLKPMIGLQLRFVPFKSQSSWNFLTGLSYSTNELEGDFDNDLYYYSNTYTYKTYTKYSILRIPLTIEYSLPFKVFQPYISASYVNVILINSTYSAFKTGDGTMIPDYSPLRGYEYGVSCGIGFRYRLVSKNYFYLKADYEYRRSSTNTNQVLDYLQHYGWLIQAGYGFSL